MISSFIGGQSYHNDDDDHSDHSLRALSKHHIISFTSSAHHIRMVSGSELCINADKTTTVPFTRKLEPILDGKAISYLGITLDETLTWNCLIDNTVNKAKWS